MAQINSVVTTNAINTQTRLIRDVSNEIYMLYPQVGTILTFLSHPALQRKFETRQPKFEWFEDDYTARWAANGTTTVANTTASTVITVTDGTNWVAGDLGYIPRAINSATVGEIFRVTAVNSNALTVVRGINGQVMTVDPSAAIAILGPAYEENSSRPNPKQTTPDAKTGYTQIFRHPFSFSATQMAAATYGAPNGEFERTKRKRFQEHKRDINRAFLWGAATESFSGGPSGYPIRTTAGLNSVITTNVLDGGTTLTKSKWEEFLRMGFAYGDADTKFLFASPRVVSAINLWAQNFLDVTPRDTQYGLRVTQLESNHGRLMLVMDRMLEDPTSSNTNGFGGWAFIVNPEDLELKILAGNGVNRDTKYVEYDIENQNGVDGMIGEYITEIGLAVRNEKHHAKLYNVVASS